jgi:hypothetical protein
MGDLGIIFTRAQNSTHPPTFLPWLGRGRAGLLDLHRHRTLRTEEIDKQKKRKHTTVTFHCRPHSFAWARGRIDIFAADASGARDTYTAAHLL